MVCQKQRKYTKKRRFHDGPQTRHLGIDEAAYQRLLNLQGGVCAICENVATAGKRLVIDHCHEKDQFRGLLCHHCNTGLGFFKDSPALLEKATGYLKRNPWSFG
jgi:hypothetical protein